jgi:hypothetical protein
MAAFCGFLERATEAVKAADAREDTHLPELLGSILAGYALQDLCAAGVLIHELGHVVDVAIDDNVEAFFGGVVGSHVGGSEGLRHVGGDMCVVQGKRQEEKREREREIE